MLPCVHCGQLVFPGPPCCKARVESLLTRHEAMRSRGEHDAVDRESTVLDQLIGDVPAKDRAALATRAAALRSGRARRDG